MSKKFVLVPEGKYHDLVKNLPSTSAPKPADAAIVVKNDDVKNYDATIEILPKGIKHRAKVLLHHLQPNVSSDGRIVYPDETVGSHLYTLLKYFLSSFPGKQRPVDAQKFQQLLETVPEGLVQRTKEPTKEWRPLFP